MSLSLLVGAKDTLKRTAPGLVPGQAALELVVRSLSIVARSELPACKAYLPVKQAQTSHARDI